MPPEPKPITPLKFGEDRYISFSLGVLWAVAGAMVIGLGLMVAGVREGQQFLDAFSTFQKNTLVYEHRASYYQQAMNVQLTNVQSWQSVADARRKANSTTLVNDDTLSDTVRAFAAANSDVLHADKDKRGLAVPNIVVKPLITLPEATILPMPIAPSDLNDLQ